MENEKKKDAYYAPETELTKFCSGDVIKTSNETPFEPFDDDDYGGNPNDKRSGDPYRNDKEWF